MADLWRVTYMGEGVKPTSVGAFAKYVTAYTDEEFARSVAGQEGWVVADPSGSELGSKPQPKAEKHDEKKPEPKAEKHDEKKHDDKKPADAKHDDKKHDDKKPADAKHDDKKPDAKADEKKPAEKAEKK